MSRLSKEQVVAVITNIFSTVAESRSGNWLEIENSQKTAKIYFSQCKSSTDKSHWKYDFFHTIKFSTFQDIGNESGILVLLNYQHCIYTILDTSDMFWIVKFSSRKKSNEGVVCDVVVDKDSTGSYQLRPYDRHRSERRKVEINQW